MFKRTKICPRCGFEVSTRYGSCPACGVPFDDISPVFSNEAFNPYVSNIDDVPAYQSIPIHARPQLPSDEMKPSRSESLGRSLGAFVLSLLGGIFIILGGIAISMALQSEYSQYVMVIFLGLVVAFGLIVTIGALMLIVKPKRSKFWGVIIIIFSGLAIVTGGGLLIGSTMGIIGGVIALFRGG